MSSASDAKSLSIARGIPLEQEPGLGAQTIPGYLREVTTRYGDAEAIAFDGPQGRESWSYRELWTQSLTVARALIGAGIDRGSRVGILMTNRPEFIAAHFGIAMAGGVSVTFSTFSTAPELEHMLKVSEISVLLFEDRVLKRDFVATLHALIPEIAGSAPGELVSPDYPYLRRLVHIEGITSSAAAELDYGALDALQKWQAFTGLAAAISERQVDARIAGIHPADPGGLFFSSGTTSLPKAILHRQRAFAIQYWRWPRLWGLDRPTRSWTGNGLFWSGPAVIMVGTALTTGGAMILQPLFDEEAAIALIKRERVNLMNGRPHQWARMQSSTNWNSADFSSVIQITKGEMILAHPTAASDWEVPNAFGTTETMSILSSFEPENAVRDDPTDVGPLLPGNVVKIIDPLSGNIVAHGDRGEVCVKGPTLMIGYLGKTPEDCFDEDGFYHTGDGGYIDEDGHLHWEGRLNDIIKTGGANVSPEEVDTAIAGCPGVKRTQTVGVPHDTLSEMVVSCIVAVDGVTLNETDVLSYLKNHLASYKIPRRVLFFSESDYPLTGNEKVKAGELRELAAKRIADDP